MLIIRPIPLAMMAHKVGLSKVTVNRGSLRKSFGVMLKTRVRLTLIPRAAVTLGKNSLRNKLGQSLMNSLTSSKTSPMSNVMTRGELTSNKKFKLVSLMLSRAPNSL
jgi:hypothetical protein